MLRMSAYLSACFASMRQQLADLNAADIRRDRARQRPAVIVPGVGFRIEGVEVARPAPEPDLDYRFRLGFGRSATGAAAAREVRCIVTEQAIRRRPAKPQPERVAARHGWWRANPGAGAPHRDSRVADRRYGGDSW